MDNLEQFINKPDNELQEPTIVDNTGGDPNIHSGNGNIPADFFNSAGNTNISGEEKTEGGQTATPEIPTGDPLKPKGKIVLGKVISGKATVTIINIFIPSFFVFSLRRFGYQSTKNVWKLSKEEQEVLQPVVQECLDYIVINFDNPFYALAFVSAMIYGAKLFDAVPDLKKMRDEITEDSEYEEQAPIDYKQAARDFMRPSKEEEYEERNTIRKEADPNTAAKYKEIRSKIDSTTIRKEQRRLVIEAMEEATPADIIEAWRVYGAIYPERNENYFRQWYERNYEAFPESLRFNIGGVSGEI